jgi:hypothetical protein
MVAEAEMYEAEFVLPATEGAESGGGQGLSTSQASAGVKAEGVGMGVVVWVRAVVCVRGCMCVYVGGWMCVSMFECGRVVRARRAIY